MSNEKKLYAISFDLEQKALKKYYNKTCTNCGIIYLRL